MTSKYTESATFSADFVLSPCHVFEPTFTAVARRHNAKCSGEASMLFYGSLERNIDYAAHSPMSTEFKIDGEGIDAESDDLPEKD
ncbi:ubiquitin specific peptidase 30 (C19 family) [Echinococcus multilocularis]|uniref:Ubiquitin specific peptidase 30 (C19 family) n=1 Tax=Echinococcus multilocularis TaxID=6211 RepID=A0A0S4MM37_ECHMU|nr:ubiquitin specific peptidase 30 (C19 family) [Echinococcus multilocularis]